MTQEELTAVIAGEFVTVEASGGTSNKNVGGANIHVVSEILSAV